MIIHFPNQNVLKRFMLIFVMTSCIGFFLVVGSPLLAQNVDVDENNIITTFSIVARDSVTG